MGRINTDIQLDFSEFQKAEQMYRERHFLSSFSKKEMLRYAKYLWHLEMEKSEIPEAEIINDYEINRRNKDASQLLITPILDRIRTQCVTFCEDNGVSKYKEYRAIEDAVKKCFEVHLCKGKPVPVTVNEWKKIATLEDENTRRMAFIYLVIAKYLKIHNLSTKHKAYADSKYLCNVSENALAKMVKAKFKTDDAKMKCRKELSDKGMVTLEQIEVVSKGVPQLKLLRFVDFAENDGETKDIITDFENLDLHYERLMGENIGTCEFCGCLFRKKNNAKYCQQHRGYQKKEAVKFICEGCGGVFWKKANQCRKIRCDDCQKEADRLSHIKRNQAYQSKKKE